MLILLPYEVVTNKKCGQDIDEKESEDNDTTPNLKERDEQGNPNDSVYQCKEQEWNSEE